MTTNDPNEYVLEGVTGVWVETKWKHDNKSERNGWGWREKERMKGKNDGEKMMRLKKWWEWKNDEDGGRKWWVFFNQLVTNRLSSIGCSSIGRGWGRGRDEKGDEEEDEKKD